MHNKALANSLQLLFTRRFGTFWLANLLSSIGTWSQLVAQPWLLLNVGASSFLLGVDNFAMGAPVFFLTLLGGVLADRGDRRRIIALFQSIQMLCPLLLVILILTGAVHPWIVIGLSLVIGITDALSMPSFQTIVPSIVAHEEVPSATALNSTQFNLSRILGPALAGVLMSSVGAAGAFAVSAASYIPFILVALWILPHAPGIPPEWSRLDYRTLSAGIREIAQERLLRGALSTVLVTSLLCAPVVTFCPVLIKSEFQGDVSHFSLVMGAFGAGGLLGAVGLLTIDPSRDRRPLTAWMAVGYGAILVLTAVNQSFWLLSALFVLAGVCMTASNTSANAFLLGAAPMRIQGQTISVYMLAMRGGVSIGSLVTGLTVGLLGVRQALFVNGALAIAVQLVIARTWVRDRAATATPG